MATAGSDGALHIVPVGFRLDSEAQTIQIGGRSLGMSTKWRDLQVNPKIALRSMIWLVWSRGRRAGSRGRCSPRPGAMFAVASQRPQRSTRSQGQSVASQRATASASGTSRLALSARTHDRTVTSQSSEREGYR